MKHVEIIWQYDIEPVEVILDGVLRQHLELTLQTKIARDQPAPTTLPSVRMWPALARDMGNALLLAAQHCEDLERGDTGKPAH